MDVKGIKGCAGYVVAGFGRGISLTLVQHVSHGALRPLCFFVEVIILPCIEVCIEVCIELFIELLVGRAHCWGILTDTGRRREGGMVGG